MKISISEIIFLLITFVLVSWLFVLWETLWVYKKDLFLKVEVNKGTDMEVGTEYKYFKVKTSTF